MRKRYRWDKKLKAMVEITPETKEFHYVQDDTILPTVSHATDEGKVFTSRSALYEHYRQHGYECTGGSHLTGKGVFDYKYKCNPEDLRRDIEQGLNQVKWGMAPISEKERELCNQEERTYQEYRQRRER